MIARTGPHPGKPRKEAEPGETGFSLASGEERPSWSEAVSQASTHVQQRKLAIEEAAERQKPKSRGLLLVEAAVIFAGVIAWDIYVYTRPQEIPPPAEEAVDLRWFVSDVVELIEDFHAEQGRLPTRADLGDLLDEEFSYDIRGEGYVVGLEGEGARVEYDGSVPLDEWVSSGATGSGGGNSS